MLRREVSLTPWLQPGVKRRPGRSNRFNGLPQRQEGLTMSFSLWTMDCRGTPREPDRVVTGPRHAFPGASWPKTGPCPSPAARVYPQILLRRLFVFQRRVERAIHMRHSPSAAEKQKGEGMAALAAQPPARIAMHHPCQTHAVWRANHSIRQPRAGAPIMRSGLAPLGPGAAVC